MKPLLSTAEQAERAEIDATLAETKAFTVRHIDALWRCHEKGLWRSTHKSFKEYSAEHSILKESAIYRALKAETIRKQLGDCSTATVVSDRTALALDKMKSTSRKRVFKAATKAAAGKPVTPRHIEEAEKVISLSTIADSPAYKFPPMPPPIPKAPTIASQGVAALPTISDPQSAAAFITALYERDKSWFNDLSTSRPRTPRDIIDHITEAITSP